MTESPPNTLCHTVYTDSTIGLTVTAWPNPQPGQSGWLVRFLRRNPWRWAEHVEQQTKLQEES